MQEKEKIMIGKYMSDISDVAPLRNQGFDTAVPHALIANPPAFDSESEEALALRFGRPEKKSEEIVLEYTRDPALLHQYHLIYEEQFRIVHKANRYMTVEDEHDRRGHVLIARRDNLCVGGARLSVKTPRQPAALPIEINGFKFEDHFPELKREDARYGQIGRFCLLPEFRGGTTTRMMLWHLYRKAVALGLDRIFGTAPISNARAYMKNFSAMGLKEPKIHFDIDLPEYPMCEEIKFYLLSVVTEKSSLIKEMDEYQEAHSVKDRFLESEKE